MKAVFLLSSVFSVFALLSICVFLLIKGVPPMAQAGVFKVLFGTEWDPSDASLSFGILPMIVGSVYVTLLSTALGLALGIFTALFLYKFCPRKLKGFVRQLINLLAGIPSVIIGLFGIIVVVPFVRNYISPNYFGYGIFTASIILAIMVLPTIVSVSYEALASVPKELYEGALALGATKEQAVFKVMVPAAKSGIFAAAVLSVGRAIGETMAVIMVIGGARQIPTSLFQSVTTLTAHIATGTMEVNEKTLGMLIATGVVLFSLILVLNVSFSLIKNIGKGKKK